MKEFIDSVKDFLETNLGENYIWITAGVILLLIVILAIVKAKNSAHADKQSEREFFLEGEYDTMIRDAALSARAAEAQKTDRPETGCDYDAETGCGHDAEACGGSSEEQDALKEELQQVQININIERGHVKIGYEDDGKVTCIVEADDEELQNDPELTAALAAGDMGDAADNKDHDDERAVLDNREIVLEKINLVKAGSVKKFGPDNFNTGRSGRVFTEEELREQIKQ